MHVKGILVFKFYLSLSIQLKKDEYLNKKMGKGIEIGNIHKIYTDIPPKLTMQHEK